MGALVYPKWLEKKWENERDAEKIKEEYYEYYRNHKACPSCGSDGVWSTTAPSGPSLYQRSGPDTNRSWCNECGWEGIKDDMVPLGESPKVVYNLEETKEGMTRCVCRVAPPDEIKETVIQ